MARLPTCHYHLPWSHHQVRAGPLLPAGSTFPEITELKCQGAPPASQVIALLVTIGRQT